MKFFQYFFTKESKTRAPISIPQPVKLTEKELADCAAEMKRLLVVYKLEKHLIDPFIQLPDPASVLSLLQFCHEVNILNSNIIENFIKKNYIYAPFILKLTEFLSHKFYLKEDLARVIDEPEHAEKFLYAYHLIITKKPEIYPTVRNYIFDGTEYSLEFAQLCLSQKNSDSLKAVCELFETFAFSSPTDTESKTLSCILKQQPDRFNHLALGVSFLKLCNIPYANHLDRLMQYDDIQNIVGILSFFNKNSLLSFETCNLVLKNEEFANAIFNQLHFLVALGLKIAPQMKDIFQSYDRTRQQREQNLHAFFSGQQCNNIYLPKPIVELTLQYLRPGQ